VRGRKSAKLSHTVFAKEYRRAAARLMNKRLHRRARLFHSFGGDFMKLARIATVVFALLAGLLAGCQTDGGASSSGTNSTSGSSGGY
jgi:hypothetical protein